MLRRITEPSPVRVVLIFLDRVDHTPRLTYSPIWYPGRENVTCHVDPSLVVKVPKFLKALELSGVSAIINGFTVKNR